MMFVEYVCTSFFLKLVNCLYCKVMIIPCNCCFSDYKLFSALNQTSSCCACMNWYLSSWVPGSTEEDVRYSVPMSRHRQSPFSTRWICISHVFQGGVLKMHPIKDCGPRRIYSKACWEKEQVEHRRNLSLQSNAGIKLSIDIHTFSPLGLLLNQVSQRCDETVLCFFGCLKTWFHQIFTPRTSIPCTPTSSPRPLAVRRLQWQRVDGGHTTGGFYRFGGKDGVGDGMGLGLGKWMVGMVGVGSKSYELSC